MIVFRAELLEQRNRLGVWLDALHRSVRHIDGRLSRAIDRLHSAALEMR